VIEAITPTTEQNICSETSVSAIGLLTDKPLIHDHGFFDLDLFFFLFSIQLGFQIFHFQKPYRWAQYRIALS
jgi:hypothetical protein